METEKGQYQIQHSIPELFWFHNQSNGNCFIFSEFDALARYCSKYTGSIPVILLLGFFTSTAMQRWFSTMAQMPGIAKNATVFTMSLKEDLPEVFNSFTSSIIPK